MWEAVRRNNRDYDLEANLLLGTIYERFDRLTDSTQALERALSVKDITKDKKAEAYALQGRNAKTLWRREWETETDAAARAAKALRSGLLHESFESYERAFDEDLNHFYSGLNALAISASNELDKGPRSTTEEERGLGLYLLSLFFILPSAP